MYFFLTVAEGFPAGRNRKVQISLLVLLNAEVIRLKAAFTGKQNKMIGKP
jgi:hypothetical protein